MIPVAAAFASDCPAPAPADARALVEAQMAALTRLTQIGMQIAEACGRAATDGGEDADPKAAGLVFARVARAVRMTIALQSRLARDLAALDQANERAQARDESDRRTRLAVVLRRAAAAEICARRDAGNRHFEDEHAVEDGIEQLSAEAYERLTDAEDFDLSGRPFDEVVAGICRDLGMSPEWAARVRATMAPPGPPSARLTPGAEPNPPAGCPHPPSSSGAAQRRTGDPAAPGFDERRCEGGATGSRPSAASPLRPG